MDFFQGRMSKKYNIFGSVRAIIKEELSNEQNTNDRDHCI
jgi:hypothetical protein